MNFLSDASGIAHHGHVGGDDGGDTCLVSSIDDAMHELHIFVVDDGVHREIGMYMMFVAGLRYLAQIVDSERVCRVRPHIESSDAEIYGVGMRLYGSCQRLARTDGSHHFKIFQVHH
jgi:hypothetical protein